MGPDAPYQRHLMVQRRQFLKLLGALGAGVWGRSALGPGHRPRGLLLSPGASAGRGLARLASLSLPEPLGQEAGSTAVASPAPGSPRARLLERSTLDTVRMYLYNTGGSVGREYTEEQIAAVAGLYDLLTWVYAGSGVTGAA